MEYLLAIIGGYLLGSIPFGLILTRIGGYGDIRDIGSGNIGATNVLRTGNKKLALATLILDGLKGAAAVLIAYKLATLFPCPLFTCEGTLEECACPAYMEWTIHAIAYTAGLFAIIGHLFPVWLKCKGGKGVATTFGTIITLQPIVGVAVCGIWLITALATRYSSLSALVAVAAAPAIAYFLIGDPNFTGMCGILATLVWFKHRANIHRLMRGEEPKIGQKK